MSPSHSLKGGVHKTSRAAGMQSERAVSTNVHSSAKLHHIYMYFDLDLDEYVAVSQQWLMLPSSREKPALL